MADKGKAKVGDGPSWWDQDIDPKYCFRPIEDQVLRLRFNHRGRFVSFPVRLYVEGCVDEVEDTFDTDKLCYEDIKRLVLSFGYLKFKCLWYQHPKFSFQRGLKPLNTDGDLLELIADARGCDVVDVFVEHEVDIPEVVDFCDEGPLVEELRDEDDGSSNVEEVVMEEVRNARTTEVRDESAGKRGGIGEGVEDGGCSDVEEVVMEDVRNAGTAEDNEGVNNDVRNEVNEDAEDNAGTTEEPDVRNEVNEDAEDNAGTTEEPGVRNEVNQDAEECGYLSEEDEDYVASGGESEFDTDFDIGDDGEEQWDWTHELPEETFAGSNQGTVDNEGNETQPGYEWSSQDESDLHAPVESDDELLHKRKFTTFRFSERGDPVRFELGMQFASKALAKDDVKEHAMESRTNLRFKKNDKQRLVVKCLPTCSYHMLICKRDGNQFWQVTSLKPYHECVLSAGNTQAKTEWLAKKFIPLIRHTPHVKPSGLVEEAFLRWNVTLNHFQAYRAKRRAVDLLEGAVSEQYAHLRSYVEEIRRSNPNSTVIIKRGESDVGPVFERIYICLEACKAAFASTCRPLIGLDACFLKGEHGGQLISAVGRDGNNQMLPIAYAVVESETKDSWKWFVELLLEDLNQIVPKQYAFISDQQKGLVEVIKGLGENVEHRFCVKHLYGNWKKRFPGAHMKELLWMAARATTVPDFNQAMQKIKDINEEAYNEMAKVPPAQWSRSAFSTRTQSDLQVNNMCEAFNRAILGLREKPAITLLEGIKHYITVRIVKQRQMLERYNGDICPKIQVLIEKNKRAAGGWKATWHGDMEMNNFSVSNETDTYVVNLAQKTCACRKWDLTGIPCAHVIPCIWHNGLAVENFMSSYYRKSQCLVTYSHIVLPSNGPKLWPVTNTEHINPPAMRRSAGRPKKLRKKANDEPVRGGDAGGNGGVLPRQLKTVKCMKCNKYGHNSRTCKGKSAADKQLPKGANKQKKTKGKGKSSGKAKTCPTGPSVLAAGPTGPSVQAAGPTGPQVNDAGPSVKVAGVRQKRKEQRTKAKDVEVVVSQGSQAPQTQPSQD